MGPRARASKRHSAVSGDCSCTYEAFRLAPSCHQRCTHRSRFVWLLPATKAARIESQLNPGLHMCMVWMQLQPLQIVATAIHVNRNASTLLGQNAKPIDCRSASDV